MVFIVLTTKDFNTLVWNYFSQLLSIYKTLWEGNILHKLDWMLLIKAWFPAGVILSLMLELYTAAQPEWVKKERK